MSSTGLDFSSPDPSAAGAYLVAGVDLVAIDAAASDAGLHVHKIDFKQVGDLAQAIAGVAASFEAPPPAPAHCAGLVAILTDAARTPSAGHVVLIDNAIDLQRNSRTDFTRLLDAFDDAARDGVTRGAVFWAFVALDDADFAGAA